MIKNSVLLNSSSIPINSNGNFKLTTNIPNLEPLACIFTVSGANIGTYNLDNICITIQ